MRKLVFLLSVLILLSAGSYGQKSAFYYVSPVDGARFINPEQVILLKSYSEITAVDKSLIELKNEQGMVPVNVRTEANMLFIDPVGDLNRNARYELVMKEGAVRFSGQKSEMLRRVFFTEKQDNTALLADFYQRDMQLKEKQAFSNHQKSTAKYKGSDRENNYPAKFPVPEVINRNNPDPRPMLITISPFFTHSYKPYVMILDTYGTPLYFKQTNAIDLKVLPNGLLTYCFWDMFNPIVNYYLILDNQYEAADTIRMGNGYLIDAHDILLLDNGHYLTMAYDPQVIDMSEIVPGGQPDAVVTGAILQEVDNEQNVYWEWRSWDHFEITDATDDIDLTAPNIDYVHANAFEFDHDGNLLLSSRHMDEITKINFETGDIIWRMGVKAKNNQFTFSDTVGWSHQHDIRVLPDGNMTVYDNGNLHKPYPFTQALEYEVDQENLTANKIWDYQQDTVVFSVATGSNRRITEDRALIGWGLGAWPLLASEVSLNGEKYFDMLGPDSVLVYRALKQEWNQNVFTFNKDTLDFGEYDNYIPVSRTFKITNQTEDTITITSSFNHLNDFWLVTQLPLVIPPEGETNVIVNFQPQGTGEFTDVLTLNYDNADTTERIARQIVMTGHTPNSIAEYQNNRVSVYPNPVTDMLNIQIDFNGEKVIKIYDMTGRQVMEQKTGDQRLQLSTGNMIPGVYTGFVKSDDGMAVFRFVKK
jgi:hypothetical protein